METKIIKAVFGAVKSIITQPRYRYDYGQIIEVSGITLPESFEARFSNAPTGTSVRVLGSNQRVAVPDALMRTGKSVWCYITVHDAVTDGRTMYTIRIPIKDATERTDAEPTPVQQDVIEQAIAALNAAVEQTAQDVEAADASAQSASDSADRAETARDAAEGYVDTIQGYAQQAQTSAANASASATASANSASQAQQIKTDVEGMVDEAQSAAGASAQSALESAQSASQASVSASSASQSADTASTKASEASNSAQTASTKATEASGYASTASQKASEASQSATQASGYATAAGQAKTAAETAQGLAEQAQSNAESAKDDAESARDEAQQIASGITGKVEQIDSNTERIESLEDDRYKPYPTDIVSGSIASFPDGADNVPMVDVKVTIDPVQDLHGYDHPWPAGGGKNLFNGAEVGTTNQANWGVEFSGDTLTITHKNSYSTGTPKGLLNLPVGTYIVSFASATRKFSISLYIDDAYNTILNNGTTFTIEEGKTYFIVFTADEGTPNVITKFQIESGSIATAYAPYSNICHISGWTEVNVNHSDADMTNPTTLTIPLGQTVYGGKLDVLSGVLTVDRANIASYNGETLPSTWISDRDAYAQGATPTTGAQVVYELATPITYQLTPQQVSSLYGVNNIWADSGDTEVEYRANTKLWVQKKIAEAISALS